MSDDYSTERIYLGREAVDAARENDRDMKRSAAAIRENNQRKSNVATARKYGDDSTRRDVGGLSRSPRGRKPRGRQ